MKAKGQTFEILGMVVLGVAIIGLLFFLGVFSMKDYTNTAKDLTERQQLESFKAGVNSILYTTESRTGKTMIELLGIAAKSGNTTIYFGPGVGEIDVKKELEWKFDAIYGKGNWYLRIPFPNVSADVQIVAVVDTSASMCEQIYALVTDVPQVIDDLRANGKKAEMTIFLLGTPSCCIQKNGAWIPFDVRKETKETDYFHVVAMPLNYENMVCRNPCGGQGSNDEDWGAGLECAIAMGPYKGPGQFGWRENVIKVAIPISDELPGGTECGCPSGGSRTLFDRGLKRATQDDVYIFAFRGDACGTIKTGAGCQSVVVPDNYCSCSRGTLSQWMDEMSNTTKGQMYDLSDVSDSAETIEKIIKEIQPNRVPYLEAGTVPPKGKNIRSSTNILPVTVLGKYVELYVYHWNK
ncbi:MAG: hypothetical protein JW727_01265 [Candidatus Aenigmarchaeota archaeon]|nr:hypothetical protein [Candidatus Aenigmarchaeota archaeon]